jgi:hypothetical protein
MRTSTLKISLIFFSPKFFEPFCGSLKDEKDLKKEEEGQFFKALQPNESQGHFRQGSNEIEHSFWSRALNWSQGF